MLGAGGVDWKRPIVHFEVDSGGFGTRHVIRDRTPTKATLHAHAVLVHLKTRGKNSINTMTALHVC